MFYVNNVNMLILMIFINLDIILIQTQLHEERHKDISATRQNEILNAKLRDVSQLYIDISYYSFKK